MTEPEFSRRLDAILNALQGELQRLFALLQAEEARLRERDSDGIAAAARDKLEQVQNVERSSAALNSLLAEKGLKADRSGLAACLTTPELQQQWNNIAAHLEACGQLNRVNGGVIEVSRHVVERVLTLMRGELDAGGLYSAAGKVNSSPALSPIAKA